MKKIYITDEKCCGSCKHFKNEEINGVGWCVIREQTKRCSNGNHCIVYEQQTEYDDERLIELMKECDVRTQKEIEKLIKKQ